jgi:hypothetical protein
MDKDTLKVRIGDMDEESSHGDDVLACHRYNLDLCLLVRIPAHKAEDSEHHISFSKEMMIRKLKDWVEDWEWETTEYQREGEGVENFVRYKVINFMDGDKRWHILEPSDTES